MNFKKLISVGTWLAATMVTLPTLATEPVRQHGAHQHGTAELRIAVEGQTLQIELESPAMNIVGFEHHPRSAAEKKAAQQAAAALRDPGRVFELPATAKCALREMKLEGELVAGKHSHHRSKSKDTDNDHSEIEATYRYTCAQPDALREIDVKLFVLFPKTEKLNLELVGPKGQKADVLTRDKPRVVF